MKALHSLLQQYLPFKFSPDELAERLGMLGLEVEGVEDLSAPYKGFVAGKVLSVDKHPNADRLTVCSVAVKGGTLQIVCGAPNVSVGQKVPVGTAGAVVPRNQHDPGGKPFVLKNATIRGVESQGMICSEFELGVGEDADGIMVLEPGVRVGTPLARVLGLDDIVYHFEVTPNRSDWLGHFGIAREIGILTGRAPALPRVTVPETPAHKSPRFAIRIEDKENCLRFAVRLLDGITVGESPEWLKRTLRKIGLRPVNAVVDITNFVMMETGQPLHAFDRATLKGDRLIVRRTSDAHPFGTLDGKTVTLPKHSVMVCDAEREVSIAGVMGGRNSEISETTTSVVLEGAWWNPSSIRRTAKALGLSTDASYRFERGVDPDMIPYAIDRAARLILDVAGGKAAGRLIDHYPGRRPDRRVTLRTERVNQILGTAMRTTEIGSLLKPLGLRRVRSGRQGTVYAVPNFRPDLEREIDLVEEVARLYGYDRIDEKQTATVTLPGGPVPADRISLVRESVIGRGFREVVTFPLVEAGQAAHAGVTPVMILNPLSAEMNALRTSLIPGLLTVSARNIRNGNSSLRIFEIGNVFRKDSAAEGRIVDDFKEETRVALAMTGMSSPLHWASEDRRTDIFDIKGEVQALVESATLDKCCFISYRTSDSLVDNALAVETLGATVGYLGRVRSELLKLCDIDQDVFVAELYPAMLRRDRSQVYRQFSRLPRVRRDVAFVVDRGITSGDMEKVMMAASTGLVRSVDLFDLYEGKQLPAGKKSLAFSLELVPEEKTLTDEEIDHEVRMVVSSVVKAFDAQLRS